VREENKKRKKDIRSLAALRATVVDVLYDVMRLANSRCDVVIVTSDRMID